MDSVGQPLTDNDLLRITEHILTGNILAINKLFSKIEHEKDNISADISNDELKDFYLAYVSIIGMAAIKAGIKTQDVFRICKEQLTYSDSICSCSEMYILLRAFTVRITAITARIIEQSKHTYYFPKVMKYVSEHLYEELFTEKIAESIGVSRSYLSVIFKKETGETLANYIQKMKINEACRRLATSSDTICQISDELGFSSSGHLTKVFKKLMNCTPKTYRKRLLQKH